MTQIERITEDTLSDAVAQLVAMDPDFARALEEAGPPPLRYRPPGFETLLRIIVAQQVSLASAAAIWSRLEALAAPLEPERLLSFDEDSLRGAGLSRQKARYARSLAELLQSGELDLAELDALDDETAVDRLVQVKGLGRWSAECYLLFSHGRPDVFPGEDVGLMLGLQNLRGLAERPNGKALRASAEDWKPLRAVAARMLWHYRRFAMLPAGAEGSGVA
ncbi:DNA-3-methyladenine glycosylase family protein [Aquibaculum arenosum]|uniref:DNA-3-methyladenine glycosylase II n=1 Tax=Aquibaculum arenosum TaxID=3032591 RepID=A0ABT5YPZ0_9PROT|nr:DNA-3-methyladenine glycosylase [Fodinicurvata sp. CAU 1616]MDF2097040.1 DNA-3-methyladenine glycosylase [Fodinicurvata sp. CAU 1616]